MSARGLGLVVFLLAALTCAGASAQSGSLRIEVVSAGEQVPGASIVVNGVARQAADDGVLRLELPPGTIEIVVVKEGLAPSSVTVELRVGETRTVTIDLKQQEEWKST
jgi:hypothetical protein